MCKVFKFTVKFNFNDLKVKEIVNKSCKNVSDDGIKVITYKGTRKSSEQRAVQRIIKFIKRNIPNITEQDYEISVISYILE